MMPFPGRLLRSLFGLAFVASWLFVFGPATLRLASPFVQSLAPAEIVSDGGNSYVAPLRKTTLLPLLEIGADTPAQPTGSSLEVLEDGKKLGPSHSMRVDIAATGAGRYSHWAKPDVVFFSTSDNTDPRTNGRKYTVFAQPEISGLLFVLVVLPASAVILQWLLSPWLGAATIALAAAALVAWLWLLSGHLMLSPDSTTYTTWRALVPLGYPLFLSGIKSVFGTYTAASAIQVSLAVGASLFLALAIARLSRYRVAGFATLFVLLCYFPMFSMGGHLLSEALFTPLILINVGAAIFLIVEPKIRYGILLALTAALVMFVRPAGYFIPLGAIFLALASASQFRWMLKWAVAPMIVLTLVTLFINVAIRGNTSPSQVGRNIFPHVAFLFDPAFVTGPEREYATVVDEVLKPHRATYQNATSLIERFVYSMNDSNSRLSDTDLALYAKFASESNAGAQDPYRRLESLYVRFFRDTIYNKPAEYLSLVLEQIVGGWQLSVLFDGGRFAPTYLEAGRDGYRDAREQVEFYKLPIRDEALLPNSAALESFPGRFIDFFESQYRRIRGQRRLIYLIGVITLLAIPIAIVAGRRSRHWLALGYCGTIIHGSIFLTAAVTVFIPRYAMPIDPLILVAGVIIVDMFFSRAAAAIRLLRGFRKSANAQPAGVQSAAEVRQ